MLIDGHPRNFEQLSRSNRAAKKVQAAVCKPGRNVTMPDYNDKGWGSGLVSVLEYNTPAYANTWKKMVNTNSLFHMPCRGLSEILADTGTPVPVDFLTIDVQGAEDAVLESAELGLVGGGPTAFKVVLVEAESTAMGKNVRVRKMLEAAGLKKLKHEIVRPFHASYNELYVRPDLVALNDPRPSQNVELNPRGILARFLNGVRATPDVWGHNKA